MGKRPALCVACSLCFAWCFWRGLLNLEDQDILRKDFAACGEIESFNMLVKFLISLGGIVMILLMPHPYVLRYLMVDIKVA